MNEGWVEVKMKPLKEDKWNSQFAEWLNLFLKARYVLLCKKE